MSLTPQIKRYVARQLGSGDGTAPSAWIVSGSDIAYTQGNVGIGVAPPSYQLDVGGDLNIAGVYRIGGTTVLTASSLGSGIVTSSLTTVGTIGTGVWQGTAIANAYIATGLDVTKLTVGTTLPSNVVTSSLTAVGTIATGVWQGTAISDTYLATISTAGKVSNSATTATSANTVNAIVARDASGNFSAGTITASLSGNATTATTADKVANALTAGTYLTAGGTFDGSAARTFAVDATDANTASKVVARDAAGAFSAGAISATALTSTGLVTFASLKGTGATTVTNILDEDNMASNSDTALATQQSIKAYVDAQVTASDSLSEVLAIGNTTGANDIIVSAGQKIRTPAIAAGDGTASITIANSTGALTLSSALADSNLATISTAGKVSNSATTATASNTNSAIVARDGSGNFSAGTITASLSGNATTATTADKVANALTAGTYLISGGTFDGAAARTFAVDATDANTASKVVARDASGNFAAGTITATFSGNLTGNVTGNVSGSSGSTTGNAATATALSSARTFALTGDITGSVSSDLTSGASIATAIAAGVIVNADISASAAIADTKLDTIATAGKVSNSATTATASNTPSTIVLRDGSGNFSAGTVTATFAGNLTGNVTGDVSGNAGTVTNGVYTTGTYSNPTWITSLAGSKISGNISGNAANVTGTVAIANGGTGTTAYVGYPRLLLENGDDILLENGDYLLTETAGDNRVIVFNPATNSFTTVSAGFPGQYLRYTASTVKWDDVATAGALSSARTFALTGDITGSVSSDLTSGFSITTSIPAGTIVNADINASAAIADTKLATISTAGKVANSATTATSANTASAIVARDSSGNFTAGTITATLSGAAPAGSLSGSELASGVTASSLTSVGTLASLTVSGTTIVASSSGDLVVGNGDTSSSPANRIIRGTDGTGTDIAGAALTIQGGRGTGSGSGGPILFSTSAAGVSGTTLRTATERVRITPVGFFKASNSGSYYIVGGEFHEFRTDKNNNAVVVEASSNTYNSSVLQVRTVKAAANDAYFFEGVAASAVRFYVESDGDVYNTNGTYGTISDERLKQDIVDASSQWDDIKGMRFRKYRLKSDVERDGEQAKVLLGVIAQELEQVCPNLVNEKHDGTKHVNSSILLMKAAVALQEAIVRIEILELKNLALEGRIAALENA